MYILFLDIQQDILWLKHNLEPWTEVIEKWTRTFQARKNSTTKNFHEFLKEWTPLKDINRAECLVRCFQS